MKTHCFYQFPLVGLVAICSLFAVAMAPTAGRNSLAWAESRGNPTPPPNMDDGWRRTSHGWERITRWEATAMDESNVTAIAYSIPGTAPTISRIMPRSLSELHPVTIALSMLLASVLAYQYLPPAALNLDTPFRPQD